MVSNGTPLPPNLSQRFPVLSVADVTGDTAVARSAAAIRAALEEKDIQVVTAKSLDDGETAIRSDPGFSCIVMSWALCKENLDKTTAIIRLAHRRAAHLPIMLAMSKASRSRVPLEIVENVDGFIWLPEDSPKFIAGRIQAAAKRYLDSILPPFFGAHVNFDDTHEYSWHTPGHTDDSYSFVMRDRVFTGDTLLIRSTGRTDFQNGDPGAQYDSLFGRLLKLADETLVYPAHDYHGMTVSTIGEELLFNPRLQVSNKQAYVEMMNGLQLEAPRLMDIALPGNQHCGLPPSGMMKHDQLLSMRRHDYAA